LIVVLLSWQLSDQIDEEAPAETDTCHPVLGANVYGNALGEGLDLDLVGP
jgi:hypothetical protein